MAPRRYAVKELTRSTWPDFERLFEKPGEWGVCWCVYYSRARSPKDEGVSLERRAARNRREKKASVSRGTAHGILVYDGEEPVGWCQYGPREEIPRVDAMRRYKALNREPAGGKLWRISCFSVERRYRKKGVASRALEAALDSIKRQGGGLVEAYPVRRTGALATWFGTVSMFEKQGFELAAPFGKSNVLMEKIV
ncbi:MAG: GNAT family N-acetyltransferase [Nitrososphaerota archaeon]|nr:GNAT family N-acetyltransferase [Nitrososphaerota archaeon]MDG7026057.1 GNAT family N-acetyltransferase [Nitrososphaerota archaeon]